MNYNVPENIIYQVLKKASESDLNDQQEYDKSLSNYYFDFINKQSNHIKANLYEPKYLLIGEVALNAINGRFINVIGELKTKDKFRGLIILESDQRFKCEVLS